MSDDPCVLRLQEGVLYYEGLNVGDFYSGTTCPAASLRTVRVVHFGLVLVFQDGAGLAVPSSAFSPEQSIHLWKQALEQAMSAPPADVPKEDWPAKLSRDEEGNLMLVQQADRDQVRDAYKSAFFDVVVFTGVYWKRNWVSALFVCAMLYLLAASTFTTLFTFALILYIVVYKRYVLWKTADKQVGRTALMFTPDALVRIMPDGTRMRLPYTEPVRLLATPTAIGLYWPKGNAIWCVTREVISPSKAEALITLLRQRFSTEA